ncbi:hypothetical protein [Halomonas sp. M4R1S46]|uniref:hypothetical protein n=1 Tax=Halomonas sp. M4R1S46 TaxID=2982692 RepID=UPI0021E375FB|nr:hypothetical protein [Halomonas sp. M4R1S46]UYG08332.1 hypothetical protein OCT48_03025 [Halomonas sp. M4R1S46]
MRTRISWRGAIGLAAAGASLVMAGSAAAQSDKLQEALSATWPGMVEGATVVDWEGKVLQEGSNGYTCMPSPPDLAGNAPMCLDEVWLAWAKAWQNEEPFTADRLGIAYMLQGDEGASNIDPYAMQETDDNQWVVEGPHLMVIAPPELLEGMPTDPDNGGPYVMWEGTDYQHIMVPVGARDEPEGD